MRFLPSVMSVMMMLVAVLGWAGALCAAEKTPQEFLEEYPQLKKLLYKEPDTHLRVGLGVSPIQMMKNKAGFSANILEIHWMRDPIDWEVFSASYGATLSGDPLSRVNTFGFKTIPKYRISGAISAGPLVGYELISFPGVMARIYKGTDFSSDFEPFSTRGWIYGGALSENFNLGGSRFQLKLSQLLYKQTYSVQETYNGWSRYYLDDRLNKSKELIEGGMVFLMQVSIIY